MLDCNGQSFNGLVYSDSKRFGMEEELREQLEVLGVEPDPSLLSLYVNVCSRLSLDAENFAEQWVAFRLSKGINLTEDRALQVFEREAPRSSSLPPPLLNAEDNFVGDYLNVAPNINENISEHGSTEQIALSLHTDTALSLHMETGKYATRQNSGEVVFNYGEESNLKECNWKNFIDYPCDVNQLPNHSDSILNNQAMYGLELLQHRANLLNKHIKRKSQDVIYKANVKETVPVKCKSQIPISIVGRIDCDANGRLNPKSVLLQGTWEDSMGHNICINLDQINHYSLFPGQVVAMNGLNTQGDKFIAHEIFVDGSNVKPSKILLDNSINGPVHVIVACGPFTTSDNLTYSPLGDLIKYIMQNKPHIVILIGPFLDADHQSVLDNSISETYKLFFEKLVDTIMTSIESSSYTRVVMVANSKDVFHTNIYPTRPFSIRKTYKNLMMVSDPCILNINGIKVGLTSTDILMHLSKEEISCPIQGPDKLGRLASHLLYQQSFYPLWPPNPALSIDTILWSEYASMVLSPHILVIPSDFRHFVKNINDTLIINPERLSKGTGGGMFARLQIQNSDVSSNNILCQILRI